jgi:positive regulator of sigma E activity
MGGYSWFPWLIIAALLVYLLLLVKIARARTIAKPIKDSKAWLITQTVFAWLFAFRIQDACDSLRDRNLATIPKS